MARVLGRIRLSRDTDASTSQDRQRDDIQRWADNHGHDVVGWAVDIDISGSIRPFDTPELGDWLRNRFDDFDIIVSWTLARISRNSFNTNEFLKWCKDNDKDFVTTDDKMNIDMTTTSGKLLAAIMSIMAENELEEIRERAQASQKELRRRGRWHGGAPPYGYTTEKRQTGEEIGWYLVPDLAEAAIVREIFERASTGEPLHHIAEDLNIRNVPTRKESQWTRWTIRDMLKARNALGQSTHNGRVVVGSDGMPVQRAEPLISLDLWRIVQGVRADRDTGGRTRRSNGTGLLLNVAYCGGCGEPLYYNVNRLKGGKYVYHYWRCSGRTDKKNGCEYTGIRAETLEELVEEQFLNEVREVPRTKRVFLPAEGYAEEIGRAEDAMRRLLRENDEEIWDEDDDLYIARLKALKQRLKTLKALPNRPARWEHIETGETFGEAWERMETDERRQLLLDAGVRVDAKMISRKTPNISIRFDLEALSGAVPGYPAEQRAAELSEARNGHA